MITTKSGGLRRGVIPVLLILPVIAVVFALAIGRIYVPVSYILESIAAKLGAAVELDGTLESVLWKFRLPRILQALLVGAGLSVSGCVFQSLFSNPLATPDTLGVASGASFGAALALMLGLGLVGVQAMALVFGVGAVALTYIAISGKRQGVNIILSGIMVGRFFDALISLIKFVADTESKLPVITYWLMGSFSSAGFKTLALGAPIIIIGIIILFLIRWKLNLLPLSEDEMISSGVNVRALRLITILCASAITASCVSMCGQVGWVGLLVPHICRMLFGSNHLSLIPSSIFIGAVFMLIVDTIARSVTAAEIPVSILTAIIGAPFFIILMRRSRGWQL